MRIPDPGPLGETFLDASVLAIVEALFVKRPAGGNVETVFTLETHLLSLPLACVALFLAPGTFTPPLHA